MTEYERLCFACERPLNPSCVLSNRARGKSLLYPRGIDRLSQLFRSHAADDLPRSYPDCRPIFVECGDVHGLTKIGNLLIRHPCAHIAARDVEALSPIVFFKHLRPSRDDQVHTHILSASHVPEQPGERVQPFAWPKAQLVVIQTAQYEI